MESEKLEQLGYYLPGFLRLTKLKQKRQSMSNVQEHLGKK